MPGEHAVCMGEHGPGAHPGEGAALLDADSAEVPADVDQDAVPLCLSVEAGAGRPQGDRDALAAGVAEQGGDLAGVAGADDGLREEAVGAGIGGVADEVERPRQDPVLAEQPAQVRPKGLWRTGRELLRGAVDAGGDGHD